MNPSNEVNGKSALYIEYKDLEIEENVFCNEVNGKSALHIEYKHLKMEENVQWFLMVSKK